ncbi:hypothetical protein NADFUDRAFT_67031 [Nadsonia fulvescens var. elongata DSM 6958]|uniref:Uncharacterized protein n=1 Tax=Nadsonia fulvescens var. elongata DSM 6958 TaxID=857566 RepID=A0A1E3PG37_9ASCO|nr:hypothetical protein NADFUDRAFT_67031 [Nadsonia fulvescens var. elongata DSM 6958]
MVLPVAIPAIVFGHKLLIGLAIGAGIGAALYTNRERIRDQIELNKTRIKVAIMAEKERCFDYHETEPAGKSTSANGEENFLKHDEKDPHESFSHPSRSKLSTRHRRHRRRGSANGRDINRPEKSENSTSHSPPGTIYQDPCKYSYVYSDTNSEFSDTDSETSTDSDSLLTPTEEYIESPRL